jgi:tetratricopeptide (TPR) repeat protein
MTRRMGVPAVFVFMIGAAHGCAQQGNLSSSSTQRIEAVTAEATHLQVLAEKLYRKGKLQEATRPAARSLALRENALGPRHPDVAISLTALGLIYRAQGAYAKAESLLARALDIREKTLRDTHPDVTASLNALASLYYFEGAYGKAEPLLIRALAISELAFGPMHLDVATSLNSLALVYSVAGAYQKAEPLLIRALNIREKTLGSIHPAVGQSLNNLANFYEAQGAHEKAIASCVRALDISEKALGPLHTDTATTLNNLANIYQTQGEYAKAEPLYIRALAIKEQALGPMHADVAMTLNNLAALYQAQGAYKNAEPLWVRALAIKEKARGPMHPTLATGLNNLAELYRMQGAYTKAEPLYVRALAIWEGALGPMHPDVARSLNNLAELYRVQGAYVKAEPLHARALDIREKALGRTHPDVSQSLNNLALLYRAQGAYAKAEPLYIRALDIWEKALEATHPKVASTLSNLAGLYSAQGAYTKAEPLVARAVEIQETQLRLELARLSEPRKRALMMLLQRDTEGVVSLHADAMPSSAQALELALATVLRRKGRALDSLVDNQLGLRAHLTPALRGQLDELAAASTELSTRSRAPFDPRTAASRASSIAALRTRVDELESALNTASAEFRVRSEPITIAKLQAALPRSAALIEFVRYHRYDARQATPWQEERYVAYVLRWHSPPQWVALGEAAPIDAAIDAVLATMHKGASPDPAKAALQHLDTLVFAPLRGQLTNVSHVILSPDGKLNLVPFEALIDRQGRYEMEQRLVSYVTSGRDFLRLGVRRAPRSAATIVAAPDYGPPDSPTFNGLGTFRPLDGATAELAELPAYFPKARTLTGDQATKAALAASVGPAVLHIATHGFYAREAAATPTSENQAAGAVPAASTPSAFSTPLDARGIYVDGAVFASLPPSSEDPTDALDRAGLALAGANVRSEGIVTARELASYDWWGTQLVVLSACETGVGAVPSGEGVYGMRRALVLAGAESQVVSLWNVSDSSTRELMRAFYAELARGTGRAEALRRAKLKLLRQPKFAHPYYWAAFIPAGDWTPLDPHILKSQEHDR